jgi:putative colanic acid biosynthesis glycosyltransferase
MKNIETTIASVLNQTYTNIEYILVDGGSTDGTVELIKKHENKIGRWISQPDKGIYDAMNKGIDLATGEWIIFMNSGDSFNHNSILKEISDDFKKDYDFIYGDCVVDYEGFKRHKKAGNIANLWRGMIFSHQSVFIKTYLMKQEKYNIENKIGADFEFIFKMYKQGTKFIYVDRKLALVSAGGLSDTDRIESIKSHWNTLKCFEPSIKADIFYSYKIIDESIRKLVKLLIPFKIKNKILRFKYRKKIL